MNIPIMYRTRVYETQPAPAPLEVLREYNARHPAIKGVEAGDLRVPTEVYLLMLHAKDALDKNDSTEAEYLLDLALRRSER